MAETLLEVKKLKTSFFTHLGEAQAVRGVSFEVNKGEAIGIVGESGSGKSVTSLSIMKLLQHPGKIVDGEILFKEQDIVKKSNREMLKIRGNQIAMIFQDPMTSLNPVYTVGNQIVEAIIRHQKLNKKQARKKAINMLKLVGIPSPEKRINNYPYEFSGGMRQRVMIAIALSCEPDLLIADEPTTALDVTIQDQILKLMKDLKEKIDTSIIVITHDLGVVADVCSRIVVMYGGLIMEQGTSRDIFYNPKHPYTVGLLKSIPRLDLGEKKRLIPIPGSPPDSIHPSKGCPFADRCPHAMRICKERLSPYFNIDEKHKAMCWLLHREAPKVDIKIGVQKGAI
ncbi:ABC transporter ATP-binding protein [Dethiothermospora halolimnae]|uniref:ABC transporter ATP-binding protein n=1 Tax=Dethiothermospora halolimnae TaxID=3114390 RepID=UPI003CCBEF78